jgi:hypothetical protein
MAIVVRTQQARDEKQPGQPDERERGNREGGPSSALSDPGAASSSDQVRRDVCADPVAGLVLVRSATRASAATQEPRW